MSISICHTLDKVQWHSFLAENNGNIFHTPEVCEMWNHVKGHSCTVWAACDSTGRILAMLTPVQITMWGGLLRRVTTRSIGYGSVVAVSGGEGKKALQTLLQEYAREQGVDSVFTEFRNLSDLKEFQPVFANCGYRYEEHLNYLINLDLPVEKVFANIGTRTQKNLRRALRRNTVKVEQLEDLQLLPEWYRLLSKTYQNVRVPLADYSLFEAAFKFLRQHNMIMFWLASVGDVYVAATAELAYRNTLFGWYSGVDRSYSSECPGEVIMWHVLKWGAEHGYSLYDFGGAGKPHEPYGVRDFKAKFGGDLVCYGRNVWVPSPFLFAIGKAGYSAVRKISSYNQGLKNKSRIP